PLLKRLATPEDGMILRFDGGELWDETEIDKNWSLIESSRDMPTAWNYPELLKPHETQKIALQNGKEVEIAKAAPVFSRWAGEMPSDTYGGKPVLELNGEMVFAELAILRLFQQAGWEGRWIDSYRNRFLTGYWPEPCTEELPAPQKVTLDFLRSMSGGTGGCFDVLCWRNGAFLFVESKWKGHDHINDNQRRWLQAALDAGFPPSSFLIVEWTDAV
ncbi:MAG: VRR-NUC domain-containing protein, partial [Candidatus Binataceae bacterium]